MKKQEFGQAKGEVDGSRMGWIRFEQWGPRVQRSRAAVRCIASECATG